MTTSQHTGPIRRVIHTTGSSVLGLLGGLASGILTARMLAPDDRGLLALAITTVTLSALVAGLGSNVALRIYLPRDGRVTLKVYRRLSSLLSGLQVAVSALALLAAVTVAGLQFDPIAALIAVLPFALAAFGVSQVLDALNALGKTNLSALTNAVGTWVTAAILAVGLTFQLGFVFALLAYTVGFLARLAFGAFHLRREVSAEPDVIPSGGKTLLVKQGTKLLGLNLGQSLAFRLDQYALAAFSTPGNLGQYVVAVTPASTIQALSNSIGQVAMRDAATDSLTGRRLVAYSSLSIGATAAFAIFMSLLAPWLIPFVFGDSYAPAVKVVQVLVLAEVALAPFLLFSKVAAGTGRIRLSSWSGLLGLLAMAVFLPMFVPTWGAVGAAWSCVAGYGTMSAFVTLGLLVNARHGLRVAQATKRPDRSKGESK